MHICGINIFYHVNVYSSILCFYFVCLMFIGMDDLCTFHALIPPIFSKVSLHTHFSDFKTYKVIIYKTNKRKIYLEKHVEEEIVSRILKHQIRKLNTIQKIYWPRKPYLEWQLLVSKEGKKLPIILFCISARSPLLQKNISQMST